MRGGGAEETLQELPGILVLRAFHQLSGHAFRRIDGYLMSFRGLRCWRCSRRGRRGRCCSSLNHRPKS